MTFISLEEFLSLKDETGQPNYKSLMSFAWLEWYNISKESYELYGDDGPPLGSLVVTLRSGFGGCAGVYRTLDVYPDNKNYFLLHGNHSNGLSYKKTWWKDFAQVPNDPEQERILSRKIRANEF